MSRLTFNGDQGVSFVGRDGTRYSIQHVGLGHRVHTIEHRAGDSPRGRVATDAEAALLRNLLAANEAD